MYHINMHLCDLCCGCYAVCPTDAISYTEFEAVIDENKCSNCGNCLTFCPLSAIQMKENSYEN